MLERHGARHRPWNTAAAPTHHRGPPRRRRRRGRQLAAGVLHAHARRLQPVPNLRPRSFRARRHDLPIHHVHGPRRARASERSPRQGTEHSIDVSQNRIYSTHNSCNQASQPRSGSSAEPRRQFAQELQLHLSANCRSISTSLAFRPETQPEPARSMKPPCDIHSRCPHEVATPRDADRECR